MTRTELIRALKGMKAETGSLICLGCGHEHNCTTQGCAIIRAAAEELEADAQQLALLKLTGLQAKELYALAKKNRPTQPNRPSRDGMGYTYYDFACPACGKLLAYEPEWPRHTKERHCNRCGQAIAWPEQKEVGGRDG